MQTNRHIKRQQGKPLREAKQRAAPCDFLCICTLLNEIITLSVFLCILLYSIHERFNAWW